MGNFYLGIYYESFAYKNSKSFVWNRWDCSKILHFNTKNEPPCNTLFPSQKKLVSSIVSQSSPSAHAHFVNGVHSDPYAQQKGTLYSNRDLMSTKSLSVSVKRCLSERIVQKSVVWLTARNADKFFLCVFSKRRPVQTEVSL